ncbi:MAG: efflux RND transporter periplasmic adaptor subunit [Desulfobacteraceae bacterium]|nr:MAG: efflux RND transporter periplasmic adaptor subunit [Desulfobacteraceae bacterium]
MKKRLIHSAATGLVLLWTFSATGCNHSESSTAPDKNGKEEMKRLIQVSVRTVEPSPIRDILVLPAQTEAWQDIRVAADTAGRVDWLGPREGHQVKKDQLLAKIDVAPLKAALERAEAAYKLADELCQRRQKLHERKIINQEDLDRSITERTVAQGNLKQARIEYERGFKPAPISGFVNYLHVDEGEYVDRGKPLLDLVDVEKIKINVDVPELDVRFMQVGQSVKVSVDALPGSEWTGTVDFVSYRADPGTKTFQVRVIIPNADHRVRPGMIARVAFLRRVIPEAVTAPLFSVVEKSGERMVFVEKDGVIHARTVSLGVIEGDRIQITKGLNPGDRLVVAGQTFVEEGMKVQVQ